MTLPSRKNPRLSSWDYSSEGSYFVTFCTRDHECTLGHIPPCEDDGRADVVLTRIGDICVEEIENLKTASSKIHIDRYVVMPNHIHLIVRFDPGCDARLGEIVRKLKACITMRARRDGLAERLWQRGYHDHVIRDETDYLRIAEYVDNNPLKWELDVYHADA
jgi:putative transposase